MEGSPDSSSDSSNEVEILTVKKPPKKIVPLKKSPTPSDPVVEAVKEEGAATEPGLDGVTITQESESLTLEAAKEKTVLEGEAQGPLETALEASETTHTQESDGDAFKALETMKESPEELKDTLEFDQNHQNLKPVLNTVRRNIPDPYGNQHDNDQTTAGPLPTE